jgi:ABC-type lipoprotein export system ATPase subunit
MVRLINIKFYFSIGNNKHYLFHRVNLQCIERGNLIITGDSGIGKSTLLHMMYRLIKPKKGRVDFGDIKANEVRLFSQDFTLYPHFTIQDYLKIFNVKRALLEKLNLESLPYSTPVQHLSGGEAVRFYLMLLVIQSPKMLLLDEPTHALDAKNVERIIALINEAEGLKIIATHDSRLLSIANQTLHIVDAFDYTMTATNTPYHNKILNNTHSLNLRYLRKKTKKKLFKFTKIEAIYRLAKLQLHGLLFLLPTLLFAMYQYQDNLATFTLPYYVSYLTESSKESIPNSPFNVVQYKQPSMEDAMRLFQSFPGVSIGNDYSYILPKKIVLNNIEYEVRMSYLPFSSDDLSVYISGPSLKVELSKLLIKLDINDPENAFNQVISMEKNIDIIGVTKTLSPLEKPVIYFSNIQLQWFANHFAINHPHYRFLNDYLDALPSNHLVITMDSLTTFENVYEALKENEVYTLISPGMMDKEEQDAWLFLIKQGSWFFVWLTLLVFIFFTSMVVTFYQDKAKDIGRSFIRLGVEASFFKNMISLHMVQTGLVDTSFIVVVLYYVFKHQIHLFIHPFAYAIFVLLLFCMYQIIHLFILSVHRIKGNT